MPESPGQDAERSFEEAIQRLEGVVERIDSGEAGLEESLALYEQGVKLVTRCRAILSRAEQRIAELAAPSEAGGGEAPSADAPD